MPMPNPARPILPARALVPLARALALTATLALVTAPAVRADAFGAWGEIPTVSARSGASLVIADGRLQLLGGSVEVPGSARPWSIAPDGGARWELLNVGGEMPAWQSAPEVVWAPDRRTAYLIGTLDSSGTSQLRVWSYRLDPEPTLMEVGIAGPRPAVEPGFAAAYDAARARVVLFIGADVWVLSLGANPAWTPLDATGALPEPQPGAALAYDSSRERMLLVGQSTGVAAAQVWALSLAGPPVWTLLAPGGSAPPAATGRIALVERALDRLVVMGDGVGVWALSLGDPMAWSALAATGEAASVVRPRDGWAYDEAGGRVWLFTGYQLVSLTLGGTPAWERLSAVNGIPGYLSGVPAAYDPTRQRMLVFPHPDAAVDGLELGDVPGWRHWPVASGPFRVRAAAYDAPRDRVLGLGSGTDLWSLDPVLVQWSPLVVAGTPPPSTTALWMVHDAARDRLLFLGMDAGVSTLWQVSLGGSPTWTPLPLSGSAPLDAGWSVALDPARDRVVAVGREGTASVCSVWALTITGTPAWTALAPAGSKPSQREYASWIHDPARDRMVLYGGYDGFQRSRSDVRYLALDGATTWSSGPTLSPGAAGHAAAYDPVGDRMVVYGGTTTFGVSWERTDTWALHWGDVAGIEPVSLPATVSLSLPRPNPARGAVSFTLALPHAQHARLSVVDVGGRLVRVVAEGPFAAGSHPLTWDLRGCDGAPVAPGLYLLVVGTDSQPVARRVLVLR